MKNYKTFLVLLFLALAQIIYSKELPVQYISPLPDSKYNNPETEIIIRSDNLFYENLKDNEHCIFVTGTISGAHKISIIQTSDRHTIIFKPEKPFALTETVHIKLSEAITGLYGHFEYKFFIKEKRSSASDNSTYMREAGRNIYRNPNIYAPLPYDNSLPEDFPVANVTVSNNPSRGKIFLTDFSFFPKYGTYIMIFNNDGTPFFYRKTDGTCTDFKQISNGNLVYYNGSSRKYYEFDTSYIIVDSFYTGNGYTTDQHELKYLDNGHAYLMAYDTAFIDMNQFLPGTDSNALVIGLVLQEIDSHKNVIFQWRSWDHIPITDCSNQNLYADTIDYVHGNAIEPDTDGNILLSSRHLDEITKINRSTGNIIWRLGGPKNEFTFLNDSLKFNFQHDVRKQKNGHITLFDNGNAHTPPFSRAVEYEVNEQAKTVRLVWQYRNTPDVFSAFMGNVQRLENGNSVIGWGGAMADSVPSVTEVSSSGMKIFEMKLPKWVFSYRAYRFEWDYPEIKPIAPPTSFGLMQNYPNPFNSVTNVEFDIPETQFVKLSIYDMLGREIAVLVNTQLQPQKYKFLWNASGVSSGVYFYRLSGGSYSEVKKMVLLK